MFTTTFAQMGKVRNAYANYQQGNITKSQKLIDDASKHAKSMDNAMTWVYRGIIYAGIANDVSGVLDREGTALQISIDAFDKAKELDTENEYAELFTKGYVSVATAQYSDAVAKYNAKSYEDAGDLFASSYKYAQMGNIHDTTSVYNAAVAFNLAKNKEKSVVWYDVLYNMNYDNASIYSEYTNMLNDLEQTDKAVEVAAKGKELFPTDQAILIAEANVFLKLNETKKALDNLETVISYETDNYTIYYAIGSMYNVIFEDDSKSQEDRFFAFDKAVSAYKTTIEMEPTFFDATYNLGAIIFNKGVFFLEKADALPLGDKKYDEIKDKGLSFLVEALPFLEKALELKPDDNRTLFSLKQVYSRTGDLEKYKVVNDKLKEIEE
jgi:tetratricopeptide (TPR) repeat protein